jgi:flagellar biosynthesis protein FlhA
MKRLQLLLMQQSDILLIGAVMGIMLILIIPFPPVVLDFLISLNISLSIMLVLITLNIHHPLEFSTFPALLLLTTLFRLSLNVASTRLILLQGYCGDVIQAFGHFVVGGDALVGMVIFLILVVIQFVVITKGANRISEVAARFMLDAMPGKQMSVDADLNAGSITEAEAHRRRKEVTQEAEFYGAMDGAGKFVRGDAIAGIIIIVINILGGFILGMRRGLPIEESIRTYVILTVGDGLVSQIPALLIALATGLLTTKTSSEVHLAQELQSQVFHYPRAIAMTGIIVAVFGLMPGLPILPFWGLAATLGVVCYVLRRKQLAQEAAREAAPKEEKPLEPPGEETWLAVDRIRIELGYKLIELADTRRQPTLMDRVVMLREQLAKELGLIVPPIHIVDNIQLPPNHYAILLEGDKVAETALYANYFMVIVNGCQDGKSDSKFKEMAGIDTREPAFGLPAKWVDGSQKEMAERAGYTVINEVSVLITHVSETIKRKAHQILSRDDIHFLLDITKKKMPKLVEGVVPDIFSVNELLQILQNLLWERVAIRNLPRILQTLALHAGKSRDVNYLTELVRQSLALTICAAHQGPGGTLPVITMSPDTEYKLRQAILPEAGKPQVSLSPDFLQKIVTGIVEIKEKYVSEGDPVLLVNMDMRRGMRELLYHTLPDIAVLSFQEVLQVAEIKCIGMVQPPR